jgi:phosphatidylserine/phosphatidylglycerophosphate/cardiolipin synthase-like enzyme/regulation of enolase protein 1 (concanavalin A-like superfamily)
MGTDAVKIVRLSYLFTAALGLSCLFGATTTVSAQTLPPQERLCDPTFEDCREMILQYIRQENVEIDMGFWMMTDARYANELVRAWGRGVKIRLLMDPRCGGSHTACNAQNDQLEAALIPMRNRITSGILHWKVAIFAGQGQVQFAGANYAPFEMSPEIPYVNYTDEIVYFSKDPSIVHSFMTKFDDLWVSTTEFGNYANITGPLTRSYPIYPMDPQLNFPPDESYRTRAINAYNKEQQQIDVMMFRITDEQHTVAMLNAINRGVPARLITDEQEYRNPSRLWDAYNVDKMYFAGVKVRLDGHQGINHEKLVLLRGTSFTIFGSSNWTSPSSDSQREHNMFTSQPWIYDWLEAQFERKWNNSTGHQETKPFVPLPPDVPAYQQPANGATNVPTTGTRLMFYAGLWAHLYDIYFGTTPNPPLLEPVIRLGPSQFGTDYRAYALPELMPGTRYYWKIVSKTMAHIPAEGQVWSFTTAGTAPNNLPPSVSITAPSAGATFTAPANFTISAAATDSDGSVVKVDFYSGNTLIGTDTTAPFSFSWSAVPAGSYSLTAIATDSGNSTATSAAVSVTVGTAPLPGGWSASDVGATGVAGSTSFSNGTFSVSGAGADVWGTADALHFAYKSLTGDGSIVARVTSIQNINAWTKAGVMIRNSLSPSAAQGFMLVAASASKGVPFQRRTADGNGSVSTSGSQSTAPRWVKLVRAGNLITGYESADGVNWITVGTDSFVMGDTVLIGLGVSSHVTGVNATATFDNVTVTAANPPPNAPPTITLTSPAGGTTFTAPATISLGASASDADGSITKVEFFSGTTLLGTVTAAPYQLTWSNVPAGAYTLTAVATDDHGATASSSTVSISVDAAPTPPGLPTGWSRADIGAVPIAGDSSATAGTFSVNGSGADVWGTADAFHFAYTSLEGDGTIIARVATIQQGVNAWVKAGVMIRESLAPGSPHAFMLGSASKGMAFQRRLAGNDISFSTSGSLSPAPRWVKLQRNGNSFSAYESADGANWTLVGTDTIPMGTSVLVGLAVTSHNTGAAATCTFDNVSIQ